MARDYQYKQSAKMTSAWPEACAPDTNKEQELLEDVFLSWLSGFVDAEGHFLIKLRKGYNTSSFTFEIHLHIDDLPTLTYIYKRLKIGKIRQVKNPVFFYVNKIEGIKILISIFDKYSIWTHKQLDFKSFKLAFENRNDYLNVINIKNNMNKNRQDFDNYILPPIFLEDP